MRASAMLSQSLDKEDLMERAIEQEMQHVAATMHNCRQTTDSQMSKFRNMHKDIDLKQIRVDTAKIEKFIEHESLSRAATPASNALDLLKRVKKLSEKLRKEVDTFDFEQNVLRETCISRYLIEANGNAPAELKPVIFHEVERLEENLRVLLNLWSLVHASESLMNNVEDTIVNTFDSGSFNAQLFEVESACSRTDLEVDVSTNEVLARAKKTIARTKVIAACVTVLKAKEIRGIYRKQIEKLYSFSPEVMKRIKPLIRQQEHAGRIAGLDGLQTFKNRIRKGHTSARSSVFHQDWPFRHLKAKDLIQRNLLTSTDELRGIVARSEASFIMEGALNTISRLWSITIMKVRACEKRSDELRKHFYGILMSNSNTSVRNFAASEFATISKVINISFFATRFARRSLRHFRLQPSPLSLSTGASTFCPTGTSSSTPWNSLGRSSTYASRCLQKFSHFTASPPTSTSSGPSSQRYTTSCWFGKTFSTCGLRSLYRSTTKLRRRRRG